MTWKFWWNKEDKKIVPNYQFEVDDLRLDYEALGSYAKVWEKHRETYRTTWTWDAFMTCQAGLMDEMATLILKKGSRKK